MLKTHFLLENISSNFMGFKSPLIILLRPLQIKRCNILTADTDCGAFWPSALHSNNHAMRRDESELITNISWWWFKLHPLTPTWSSTYSPTISNAGDRMQILSVLRKCARVCVWTFRFRRNATCVNPMQEQKCNYWFSWGAGDAVLGILVPLDHELNAKGFTLIKYDFDEWLILSDGWVVA